MKQQTILIILAVAILAGAGGFFAGKTNSSGNSRQFRPGTNQNFRGNRPVSGQILNSDAQSLTVKLPDGSTKIVLLTSSTQINQATKATQDDLKTGVTVAAFGTTNADGSITAQSVQINPQMMRRDTSPTPTP